MKNLLKVMLSLVVAVTLVACGGEKSSDSITILSGDMNMDIYPYITNNAYDNNVRKAVLGSDGNAAVMYLGEDGEFYLNETITKSVETVENEDGSKTFKVEINPGIKFSDGEEAKAIDFISYYYFVGSQEGKEAGFSTSIFSLLEGGSEYLSGDADTISGLVATGDYTFEATYSAHNFPYYWESSLLAVYFPMKTTDLFEDGDITKAPLVSEVVDNISMPVGAGPYVVTEYKNDQYMVLEANEHYIGDYNGVKPSIEKINIKIAPMDTDMEQLLSGDGDYLGGVVETDKINAGLDADGIAYSTYLRNGYGALMFHSDMPIIEDVRVRQAMAYLLDREEFLEAFTGGYAELVHGPYGLSMTEVEESSVVPEELNSYDYDEAKVEELLTAAGWGYDKNGNEWKADGSDSNFRYNEAGEELKLYWNASESEYTDKLMAVVANTFPQAGINLVVDVTDFAPLLENYYNDAQLTISERKYSMFNMANTFASPNNPYAASYHSDYYGTSTNSLHINDPKLDELIDNVRFTDPDDREGYIAAWDEMQAYMNEQVYMIPLYSNNYHDFYNDKIENVVGTPFWTWGNQIHTWTIEE
ncbi:MAG: ABC transporter substrate-binding protein [Bacilli bacterium]